MNDDFFKFGYCILDDKASKIKVNKVKQYFNNYLFELLDDENIDKSRNIIKRLSDLPITSEIFTNKSLINALYNLGIKQPTFCGPVTSHYTSNSKIGGSFGLPYHQDWPSMASSLNSVICWVSLTDCDKDTHSIEIVPGSHINGLYDGVNKPNGYFINDKFDNKSKILNIKCGQILIMSSFLVHRTHVNSKYDGWKLSISRRYDDMTCKAWLKNNFVNAYSTSVDRNLFLGK